MKKIEIIATVTPSRCNKSELLGYHKSGMSIARLNASHLDQHQIDSMLDQLKCHVPDVKTMLDLPGPEFRVFGFDQSLEVQENSTLEICTGCDLWTPTQVVSTNLCFQGCDPGTKIQFMNGELAAELKEVNNRSITIRFMNSGTLRTNAHIKAISESRRHQYLSETDKKLILQGIDHEVDFLALSMVENPKDLEEFYDFFETHVKSDPPKVVMKFETDSALSHADKLITMADAFFVARGDLALHVDPLLIPLIQKDIVKRCNKHCKPVFLATQILSTMVNNPHPLRAEVSDLANAILDGCDGITLSEETALGAYPNESISTAARIVVVTQARSLPYPEIVEIDYWGILMQNPDFRYLVDKISDIGERIWQRGMAEANAGNISVNITDLFERELQVSLDGEWYLVSGTGSRYRAIKSNPKQSFVLINVNSAGETVYPPGTKPTSEWLSHRRMQEYFLNNKKQEKVILHVHPPEIIALSHHKDYGSKLEKELYHVLPEMSMYLEEGVAFTSYSAPGSAELASQCLEAVAYSRVLVWQYHGLVCCGKTVDEAFDLLEIVSKAASIHLLLNR